MDTKTYHHYDHLLKKFRKNYVITILNWLSMNIEFEMKNIKHGIKIEKIIKIKFDVKKIVIEI